MADAYKPTEVSKDSKSKDRSETTKNIESTKNTVLFKEPESNGVPIKMFATWETDFGHMSLFSSPHRQWVEGFYYNSKTLGIEGMMRARYSNNALAGFWIESKSDKKCDVKKFGTYYWGRLQFNIREDAFLGNWGYCDEALDRDWNGKLL